MKKILIIVLCIFMALTVYAAAPDNTYLYEYEDLGITIVFDESTIFTPEERQYIAEHIAYDNSDDEGISTYSLCWLVGHDMTSDTVAVIQHKVSDKAPRCYRTIYKVDTCSKCDHTETTALSSIYLNCCPED